VVLSLGLSAGLVTAIANRPAVARMTTETAIVETVAAAQAQLSDAADAFEISLPTGEAAPSLSTYLVEPGDTLKDLAERFGVSVATIAAANKISDPDQISVGQELIVLPTSGLLYSIQPGETLGTVASKYGVEPSSIAAVNQIAPQAEQPLSGQKLVVPGVEPVLEAPKPKAATVVAQSAPKSSPSQSSTANKSTVSDEDEPMLASLTLTTDPESGSSSATTASISVTASVAAAEEPKPAAKPKIPVVYEVSDGDSVGSLANQFGVSVKTILLANDLSDPDMVKVGTKLRVLPVSGVEHEVQG